MDGQTDIQDWLHRSTCYSYRSNRVCTILNSQSSMTFHVFSRTSVYYATTNSPWSDKINKWVICENIQLQYIVFLQKTSCDKEKWFFTSQVVKPCEASVRNSLTSHYITEEKKEVHKFSRPKHLISNSMTFPVYHDLYTLCSHIRRKKKATRKHPPHRNKTPLVAPVKRKSPYFHNLHNPDCGRTYGTKQAWKWWETAHKMQTKRLGEARFPFHSKKSLEPILWKW